ncbi:MAG: alpha-amylase family glycosyl hydrolase [Micropruina sp.]|uniref:alpha-amylase family glycosyl hydrolase n=1 Tax=Micropruina sp. TaxID=2737536 RepID=UPI0039E50CE2
MSTSTPDVTSTAASWLADSVIYEIYPQSFMDSNSDGIGDLPGVIARLDYLAWLGIDTIWFNPCFASPFRDAGYDVSDYLTIAPRYGTNDDMIALIGAAKTRGIRVLLDLVAGHTSIDHPWFLASSNDPTDDRYVWAATPGDAMVPSPGSRSGWYLKNFFPEQPALNFGYARLDPNEPWRQPPDAPGPRHNREALREIIRFWLDRGVAGFRVDMAFSLIKDDPGLLQTTALWREIADWMHSTYPDSVLLPESDEARTATAGVRGGFDADFALVIHPEHSALFNDGVAGVLPWQEDTEPSYFDPGITEEQGVAALRRFLAMWKSRLAEAGEDRLLVLPSADHDFTRLASAGRTQDQLAAAFTFLLTWGTIPSIYYGDEIGMRYVTGLESKEGSRWNPRFDRAGCRTPMQWDDALPNSGFSTAPAQDLYLPQDPAANRPTVAAQADNPASLLATVRDLIALRRSVPALRTSAPRTVLAAGYPFIYLRGDSHLVLINPRPKDSRITLPALRGRNARLLTGAGLTLHDDDIEIRGTAHGIIELL